MMVFIFVEEKYDGFFVEQLVWWYEIHCMTFCVRCFF
jgi:hypothetical protein